MTLSGGAELAEVKPGQGKLVFAGQRRSQVPLAAQHGSVHA